VRLSRQTVLRKMELHHRLKQEETAKLFLNSSYRFKANRSEEENGLALANPSVAGM
jgi:hypothetical protein